MTVGDADPADGLLPRVPGLYLWIYYRKKEDFNPEGTCVVTSTLIVFVELRGKGKKVKLRYSFVILIRKKILEKE